LDWNKSPKWFFDSIQIFNDYQSGQQGSSQAQYPHHPQYFEIQSYQDFLESFLPINTGLLNEMNLQWKHFNIFYIICFSNCWSLSCHCIFTLRLKKKLNQYGFKSKMLNYSYRIGSLSFVSNFINLQLVRVEKTFLEISNVTFII